VRIREVIKMLPVHQDSWEHLVRFHKNGSTFDLALDGATTQQMIETLCRD